ACQPIKPIVDRRVFRHDPLEGIRGDAKARWHADAVDSGELPQVRAFSADDRDLRLVDLLEIQHVADHSLPPWRIRRIRGNALSQTMPATARHVPRCDRCMLMAMAPLPHDESPGCE